MNVLWQDLWPWHIPALLFYFFCWAGYGLLSRKRGAMGGLMERHRVRWLTAMQQRDPRMVDAMVQATLLNGIGFFASTSIVVIGGLLALFGAEDQATRTLVGLFPQSQFSNEIWEMGILMMIAIFVYAFFKFAWAYRLFNYIMIMVGSTLEVDTQENFEARGLILGRLHTIAGEHFNAGMRAFYYALALMGWFIHPLLLVVFSIAATLVQYRRDYRSRFYRHLREMEELQ